MTVSATVLEVVSTECASENYSLHIKIYSRIKYSIYPNHSASEEIQLTEHQEENQFGYINL